MRNDKKTERTQEQPSVRRKKSVKLFSGVRVYGTAQETGEGEEAQRPKICFFNCISSLSTEEGDKKRQKEREEKINKKDKQKKEEK